MNLPLRIFASLYVVSLICTEARAQVRVEQARQFQAVEQGDRIPLGLEAARTTVQSTGGTDTESFGVQQLLKEEERQRRFRAFADVSAFVTNNVALTRTNTRSDSFLVATFGLEYRQALPHGFQLEASARVAGFRYNEFRQLDFDSIDAGAGLSYHTEKLGGLDLFTRYNFNQLIGADTDESFFTNHTVTFGVQKVVSFSNAHYVVMGISGQLGFADPKVSERSEWSAFAGYHLQATRRLETDLFYRYGYFVYSEGERRDHNHTVSLAVRYGFTEWFSASASGFATWNRSERSVFDYDAGNVGGGLTLSLQF
jgi:hypothetical protein